jgi:hypothetical protein
MVLLDIGSENVTVGATANRTFVAPLAGVVPLTVGAVTSGADPVVNVQTTSLRSALPARSVAAVVNVAVYCALGAQSTVGVNATVFPEGVTTPATNTPAAVATLSDAVVSDAGAIASENVADTGAFSEIPVAPAVGDVIVTVGGTMSGVGPVVKLHE